MNDRRPIGVFDSGAGGLTAVRALMEFLPKEDIVYFGDTARVPYGGRETGELRRFMAQNAAYLRSRGAKLILAACGTVSSIADERLVASLGLPFVGVVGPAAKKVAELTRSGAVGVIATEAAVRSGAYARAIALARPGISVTAVGCPLFVPLIESGFTDGPELRRAAADYLAPIIAAGCDTLLCGCTHYMLIEKVLRESAPGLVLVDSAREASAEAARLLASLGMLSDSGGQIEYAVSGDPRVMERSLEQFLGVRAPVTKIDIESFGDPNG